MAQRLRAGRLSNKERLLILAELGEIARKKYNQNLYFGAGKYNLGILKDSLQYESDVESFENKYYVDAGSESLNKIAIYFEYGTGLHNVKRKGSAKAITPVNKKTLMFQSSKTGKMIFAKQSKGVKPVFMFTKMLRSMEMNRMHYQRRIRLKLGI